MPGYSPARRPSGPSSARGPPCSARPAAGYAQSSRRGAERERWRGRCVRGSTGGRNRSRSRGQSHLGHEDLPLAVEAVELLGVPRVEHRVVGGLVASEAKAREGLLRVPQEPLLEQRLAPQPLDDLVRASVGRRRRWEPELSQQMWRETGQGGGVKNGA